MTQEKAFFIIDGSGYIYRAFYALGRLTDARGMPTQAIYGFAQMLLKVMREKDPSHACVVFDPPGLSFRSHLYAEYKATRQRMPEDLAFQIPSIKTFTRLCGIPQLELEGYEADDIIATLTHAAKDQNIRVVVVSGDKDLHQLVEDPCVVQWDPQRDRWIAERDVIERFGVTSRQFRDFLALMGDSSDNVPGVKGVGEKTARQLIQRWHSLDGIYESLGRITPQSLQRKLKDHRDVAFLSRDLVTLKDDAPVSASLDNYAPSPPARSELIRFCEELGFKTLRDSLAKGWGDEPQSMSPRVASGSAKVMPVTESTALARMIKAIAEELVISVQLVTNSPNPIRGAIHGIAISSGDTASYFIPVSCAGSSRIEGLPEAEVLTALKPLLGSVKPGKAGHDLKSACTALLRRGIPLRGLVFDTMVGSYLLDPGRGTHTLERMAEEFLRESLQVPLISGGADHEQDREPGGPVHDEEADRACSRTSTVLRLLPLITDRLKESNQETLFRAMEMPLVEILAKMEHRGIMVDALRLQDLTKDLEKALEERASVVYDLAREEFNIQSPKQLAGILFDKLGLPVIKKTKTGPSTDVGVLEELALHHPIVEHVMAYRSLAKLKSTYADALPGLVNPETGRIHTSYNQTVTATGRLSSSEPNLQNIPIRTEEGRKIREAFVASPGHWLLSADYSQVELRILAHFSEDPHLVEAFQVGADVHQRTAAEMLNIAPHQVTPEMRRQAKTINFGIIYGMGAYGLARQLKISNKMAKVSIEKYLDRYSGVKRFIDMAIDKARSLGYTETLLGRRRRIPELQSRNHTVRQQGERLAVNTPVQGTAADLIKKAMIDIERKLHDNGLKTAMLLQVHDELVFEVPEHEMDVAAGLIKRVMEGVWPLKVPLRVDLGHGMNWAEAHPTGPLI